MHRRGSERERPRQYGEGRRAGGESCSEGEFREFPSLFACPHASLTRRLTRLFLRALGKDFSEDILNQEERRTLLG